MTERDATFVEMETVFSADASADVRCVVLCSYALVRVCVCVPCVLTELGAGG